MQLKTAIRRELLQRLKVATYNFAFLERTDHCRTDVSIAADGGRVAQRCRCLFNRRPKRSSVQRIYGLAARERARTDERPRPGAEILGAEVPSHHLFDMPIYR